MKKNLILAGVLGAFAMTAHAQSSVTLYGSLDAGIVYANKVGAQFANGTYHGGASIWEQGSGTVSDTYWGMRGSEDLGGGLHAIFTLEGNFNINNGQMRESGTLFDSQAFVGLQSNQYGTVTLGRQYDSVVDYLAPLSEAGSGPGNHLAGHPFDNDNLDHLLMFKNTVKYSSVDYEGFKAGGMYGFSNQADGFANGRAWSIGASYARGPLNVAAGYLQQNNTPGQPNGAGSNSSSEATVSARQQRTYGIGANYTYGPAQVGFVWTHSQIDGLSSLSTGGFVLPGVAGTNLHLDNFEINGAYHLTPVLAVVASYAYTDGTVTGTPNQNDPKWHTVMVATDYALSKRTDVYLAGVYQHASGYLGYQANGQPIQNVAAVNTLSPSGTGNQVVATVGLRHNF